MGIFLLSWNNLFILSYRLRLHAFHVVWTAAAACQKWKILPWKWVVVFLKIVLSNAFTIDPYSSACVRSMTLRNHELIWFCLSALTWNFLVIVFTSLCIYHWKNWAVSTCVNNYVKKELCFQSHKTIMASYLLASWHTVVEVSRARPTFCFSSFVHDSSENKLFESHQMRIDNSSQLRIELFLVFLLSLHMLMSLASSCKMLCSLDFFVLLLVIAKMENHEE